MAGRKRLLVSGDTNNFLTFLYYDETTVGAKHPKAMFKCACGTRKLIRVTDFVSGNTKACGCSLGKAVTSGTLDLTGQRFGRLIVIAKGPKEPGGRKWVCKCDCGTYKKVRTGVLRNGSTISCGCAKSERTLKVFKQANQKRKLNEPGTEFPADS